MHLPYHIIDIWSRQQAMNFHRRGVTYIRITAPHHHGMRIYKNSSLRKCEDTWIVIHYWKHLCSVLPALVNAIFPVWLPTAGMFMAMIGLIYCWIIKPINAKEIRTTLISPISTLYAVILLHFRMTVDSFYMYI